MNLRHAGALLFLVVGCGDPIPPPHVVHFVNLSSEQQRVASALSTALMETYLAVPDTFINGPAGLQVTFLHAPFASWSEPGCHASYGSAIPAQPIARAIWDAMAPTMRIEQLTLVARTEVKEYGSWFRSVSCGGGTTTLNFYPRDFAPTPAAE